MYEYNIILTNGESKGKASLVYANTKAIIH